VTYQHGERISVGALLDSRVVDANHLLSLGDEPTSQPTASNLRDAEDLLRLPGGPSRLARALSDLHMEAASSTRGSSLIEPPVEVADIRLLSPVLRPSKVIGAGMNYRSFVAQLDEDAPSHPVLFHKTSSSLIGDGGSIVVPPITTQAIPEGELAVVIGKRCKNLTQADALAHIAGFTCANDVSARDLEFRTSQWTSGKMLDTFCPLGPVLVTPDEFSNVGDVGLRTSINGEVVQAGRTSEMIFDVDCLISEISRLVTLEPGDVILTGTPSDLGAVDPPVRLQAGDVVSVEIDGIGVLSNPVVFG
jgi:2-keto-4-pentenoate hydratase/2-oxohepta-3-ene-1,7-dioic acid hydratase in catechol pathway